MKIEELLDGLRSYNRQFFDNSNWHQVGVYLHDSEGKMAGGLIATMAGLTSPASILPEQKYQIFSTGLLI